MQIKSGIISEWVINDLCCLMPIAKSMSGKRAPAKVITNILAGQSRIRSSVGERLGWSQIVPRIQRIDSKNAISRCVFPFIFFIHPYFFCCFLAERMCYTRMCVVRVRICLLLVYYTHVCYIHACSMRMCLFVVGYVCVGLLGFSPIMAKYFSFDRIDRQISFFLQSF